MKEQVLLEDLKIALRLEGQTISGWGRTLRTPDGDTIHRTSIYKAIQYGSPQWLRKEVKQKIQHSQRKHPAYWDNVPTGAATQ